MAIKVSLFLLGFAMMLVPQCESKTRVYFIGTVDLFWDYAPGGVNQKNGMLLDEDPDASVFTKKSKDRIGRIYKKTAYREFADGTFRKQKAHREDLGILGPVIKGEVGDEIRITFKNMAKRPFTMHPHGLSYSKSSEGALYLDNTKKDIKKDDAVKPGETHVYTWKVNPENGPMEGDEACIASVYHSHVVVPRDINTGLVGLLLVCKKGSLNASGSMRKDVEKEMFLMQNVFDENKSWYLDDNLRMSGIDPKSIDKEDEGFMESNLMHAVNGRFYGTLANVNVCYGKQVAWYFGALGNEVDMHTAAFTGNMIQIDHHRSDVTSLFPARTASATMMPDRLGRWLFSCKVADHLNGGMFAFYNVERCGFTGKPEVPKVSGQIKEFYIAAEEAPWSYATSSENRFDGGSLYSGSSLTFFERSENRIGGTYKKARYVEYEDSSFIKRKERSPDEMHLGMLGPVIKAEVGDVIRVVFRNKATRPYSIHPRGVWYDKENEGYVYKDNTKRENDDHVFPGSQYTYQWFVSRSVAPTDVDPPCVARLYSSNVDPVKDMYSGLMGPLVICKKGSLNANGKPKGFDAERFILMAVMDENNSWYLDENMKSYCTSKDCAGVSKEDADFSESNKMHQINGRMYGNLEGLTFCKREKILWHTFVVGTETDVHAIYFHGNGFDIEGNSKDSLTLFPGTSASFTMISNNVGKWAIVCKVNDHYMAGMKAFYDVYACGDRKTAMPVAGATRKYFIAVVEMDWNYAESGRNLLKGVKLDDDEGAMVFTKRGPARIGSVYKKAVYREFTDSTFTTQKNRTSEEEHLGILGPMIRAEEGDKIEVVLKNMASREYSIHPHGVDYDKDNEGAVYMDKSSPISRAVKPGQQHMYTWFVPKRSAPGTHDSTCITWSYYSAVDTIKDTNSGLIGPLITCRKGTLSDNGERQDIDKEFALLFTVLDENESWYLDENIAKFATNPKLVKSDDDDFMESNKMHAINGFLYGNGPNNGDYLRMKTSEKIAWYLIGFGNEVDIHTVHFHANDFIHRTNSEHRDNTYNVFPGVFETLEMIPKHSGTWLLHCHVHDHLEGGMETKYTVYNDKEESQCLDKLRFCRRLRNNCLQDWVKQNCPLTCRQCTRPTKRPELKHRCVDLIHKCSDWAQFGYCNSPFAAYQRYMQRFCNKSCNKTCK